MGLHSTHPPAILIKGKVATKKERRVF